MSDQGELFEPTGPEVVKLAMWHADQADKVDKQGMLALSRGWAGVAADFMRRAQAHREEAECLAMLCEFERLGRVHAR